MTTNSDEWVEIPQTTAISPEPQAAAPPSQLSAGDRQRRPDRGPWLRVLGRGLRAILRGPEPELQLPDQPAGLEQLRRFLVEKDFSYEGIHAALGVPLGEPLQPADFSAYVRRLTDAGELGMLIKLFIVGLRIKQREVRAALPEAITETLLNTGLIHPSGSRLYAAIRIQPFEGCFFIVDPPGIRNRHDDVLGVGPSGRFLAALTIRQPVELALDLGCGCGLQTMLAARHARRVVAVDLNPRAVLFTRFGLLLNGIQNVEVLHGDLFQPLGEQRFDLIICNPPYVISPENRLLYRDSGYPVNGLVRKILAELPDRLREGGFGHVVCHWAHRDSQQWWEPIQPWLVDRGCDAWLLHFSSDDPGQYAARWNRELQAERPNQYRQTIHRWTQWYRQQGIERITAADILFRRRTAGRNWVRAGTSSGITTGAAGEQLLRIFKAHDHLSGLQDPQELLGDRFRLSDGAQLNLSYRVANGKSEVHEAELSVNPGLGVLQSLPGGLGERIASLDGRQSLLELVQSEAKARGRSAADIQGEYLAAFQRLYGFGMLDRLEAGPRPS